MPRYEITQLVEMTVSHTVSAPDAETANRVASERTLRLCGSLSNRRRGLAFGDVVDDYVPAMEPGT